MSPSLFVLLASILCRKLHKELLNRKGFPCADDSMVWTPGTPSEVPNQTLHLTGIMAQYAQLTGQALNLTKSKVITQGGW